VGRNINNNNKQNEKKTQSIGTMKTTFLLHSKTELNAGCACANDDDTRHGGPRRMHVLERFH
jgi:hypothetical protein